MLDDKNVRRRFRASNYQSTTRVKPFICTMPMRLDDGWNQIQFNLSDFTRRAYGTNYIETLRVQVIPFLSMCGAPTGPFTCRTVHASPFWTVQFGVWPTFIHLDRPFLTPRIVHFYSRPPNLDLILQNPDRFFRIEPRFENIDQFDPIRLTDSVFCRLVPKSLIQMLLTFDLTLEMGGK